MEQRPRLHADLHFMGIISSNALPALLFSDVAVMTLVGFKAYLVEHELTHHGTLQRTGARPYVLMEWRNELPDLAIGPWAILSNGTVDAYDDRSR